MLWMLQCTKLLDPSSITDFRRKSSIQLKWRPKQTIPQLEVKKRVQRDSKIPDEWRLQDCSTLDSVIDVPKTCGLFTAQELEITSENDAVDLLRKIRERQYTAEAVTRAFCKRAAIAQQLVRSSHCQSQPLLTSRETNCLTEIFFHEAIERAKELNKEQSSFTSSTLRPLHGLPISLKDSFRVPGIDSTIGFICYANQPDDTYSALPRLLLDLGAVLYCKTNNIPQTLAAADSDNNVFGRTLNPWNKRLTAGGSSGGEGALVAMRGSVLGVGTDLAGSIRIPSLCDGIYGFRPSANIIPFSGQRNPAMPGIPGIWPVAGPMATSLRACNYFMKTVIEAEPWRYDPSYFHQHWLNLPLKKYLRVGVVLEDGLYTPWPPVRRNMAKALGKLSAAGVDLVHVDLPAIPQALATTLSVYSLDGGKGLISQGAEPLVKCVKEMGTASVPPSDFHALCELIVSRAKIHQIYHELWLVNKLDALIILPAPTTATPLDQWNAITYTALWNFLDWPAIVLPTGRVQENDLADSIETATHGERDQRNYALYTGPVDFANAPLAVQIVGMKQEDEQLAQIADFVSKVVNV